ncbi:Asp-tRNA(Asn)/Glu-tRNA(Gln) amidotransferase subunit GatA [Patescibacteria group bacterium]
MDFEKLTIPEIHQQFHAGKTSAVELVERAFEVIERKEKDLAAFISFDKEEALKAAQEVDQKIAKGEELGILEGIPFALKGNIVMKDKVVTCGSRILENFVSPYDATVVKKLKEAGAIVVGMTNMDEFAMGSSTENSFYKKTRNPHDHTRVPGGSSGGSTTAVAGGEVVFALGSDTAGSVRQPAAFCGVVGLKPTYGAVSRYGLVAMASSLDQIGPVTRNITDCVLVQRAIQGSDVHDSTCVTDKRNNPDYDLESIQNLGVKDLKIGIPEEYFGKGLDKKVKEKVETVIKFLEKEGAKIEKVSLPHTDYAIATYYILSPAEVSSNLSRYDGIRYGYSAITDPDKTTNDLSSVYLESRKEGFGNEAKRRILVGTFALSSGYYDAYYLKAQKTRTLIRKDFEDVFKKVDLLITPTTPTPAFKLGAKLDDPLEMYMSDVMTVPASLAGVPAISLPCGEIEEGGKKLPIGVQLIGNYFEEAKIFQAAYRIEKILHS